MCRHIGYIGKIESLKNIFFNKTHSIINMAYMPKEMQEAKLNADGFGIGWVSNNQIYIYKNQYPIWNDENIGLLAENINTFLAIGNVRSATERDNLGSQNTHPFKFENFMFSHNGYIDEFNNKNKSKLLKKLKNKFLRFIKGNTDSEYIFFLFIQCLEETKEIHLAIKETVSILRSISNRVLLNMLIGYKGPKNNVKLYASRVGVKSIAPSLYFLNDTVANSFYIASEKMDSQKWIKIKNHTLLEFDGKSTLVHQLN